MEDHIWLLYTEQAMPVAKERGVKFGIVEHSGYNCKIKTDQDLKQYLEMLTTHPVYKGIQPVLRLLDCKKSGVLGRSRAMRKRLPVPRTAGGCLCANAQP